MNRRTCMAMFVVTLVLSSLPARAGWYQDTQSNMGARVHVEFYLAAEAGEKRGAANSGTWH